jgi:hypothetical protein
MRDHGLPIATEVTHLALEAMTGPESGIVFLRSLRYLA